MITTGIYNSNIIGLTPNNGYICYPLVYFTYGGTPLIEVFSGDSVTTLATVLAVDATAESVSSTNSTIFAAFGIIALFVLVSAGYLISKMF